MQNITDKCVKSGLLQYISILEHYISYTVFPGLCFIISFRFHSYHTIKENPICQISAWKKTQMAFGQVFAVQSHQQFPQMLISQPLAKGNKDTGYEVDHKAPQNCVSDASSNMLMNLTLHIFLSLDNDVMTTSKRCVKFLSLIFILRWYNQLQKQMRHPTLLCVIVSHSPATLQSCQLHNTMYKTQMNNTELRRGELVYNNQFQLYIRFS